MGPGPVSREDNTNCHGVARISQKNGCGRVSVKLRAEDLGNVRIASQAVTEALNPVVEDP